MKYKSPKLGAASDFLYAIISVGFQERNAFICNGQDFPARPRELMRKIEKLRKS